MLSLFFGILLGGLLCLLLVVAARHMGLISFGEADSFYDTAVSYYSEQFGDAASAQSQDPPSFARFYTRAADTSILNSDVSLDLERILQEIVLLEGEGSEDADTADSDAADSESTTASLAKEITGKKILQIVHILRYQRFVQPKLSNSLLTLFFRSAFPGPFAGNIRRDDARDEERNGDYAQQYNKAVK